MNRTERRYIRLIAIFGLASVAAVVLALFGGGDRIRYEIPLLAEVQSSEVEQLVIERPAGGATLARSNGAWRVGPGDYSADQFSADHLVDVVVNLTITDVISSSDDRARFGLGEETRLTVRLLNGGEELRVIHIGRRAATFGHTYIQVDGDDRILQAEGQLNGTFNRGVDALRNKSVMVFDPEEVTEIVAVASGTAPEARVRIVRDEEGWIRADQNVAELVLEEPQPLDEASIESALSFFGGLNAYRFRDETADIGSQWLEVEFKADRSYVVKVYEADGNVFPAMTSESEYHFDMIRFQVGFITNPLGIVQPEG